MLRAIKECPDVKIRERGTTDQSTIHKATMKF